MIMKEFILILINPKKCYKSFKTTSFSWGKGLLLLLLLSVIVQILFFPINKVVMNHSDFLSKMPADKIEMMKAIQEKMKYIGLLTSSILFMIKMFFYTLVLWLLSLLSKKKVNFLQVLSLVIISFFVVVLGDIVNVGILYFQGIDKITSEYGIYKTGLNIFFDIKSTGPILYAMLRYFNPFQIWFVILLIIGLKSVAEIKIPKATIIILFFWLIIVFIPVFMVYIGEIVKHKTGLM